MASFRFTVAFRKQGGLQASADVQNGPRRDHMAKERAHSSPDILCVIIHFGNPQDTFECLESLRQEMPMTIAVVDNDPQQSFAAPEHDSLPVGIYKTGGSMGFAQANNFGVKSARNAGHQYVLLLNNDTVVKPGAIQELKITLANEKVGVVGPAMPYFDNPDTLWAAGGKVSKALVTIDGIRTPHQTRIAPVDYLPGAALMTRLDLWDEIGGLPERYFLAFEEAHYALEVSKRGYKVVVNTEALVFHKVGMSSDRQPMYYYNTVRNRIRFGEYLYGKTVGGLLGALSGLVRSYTPKRLALWLKAVSDEVTGKPLDADALRTVANNYRSKKEPR